MSKPLPSHSSDIISEACAWVAQIETGSLTPQDLQAFREWLCRSPRHLHEVRKIAQLSLQLTDLAQFAPALDAAATDLRGHTQPRRFPARHRLVGAMACGIFFVAMLLAWHFYRSGFGDPQQVITTLGQYHTVSLSDGSRVQLNADTRIEIEYVRKQRKIRLLYGEALFEVARDPTRPFVVSTPLSQIRAVGTAFLVRLQNSDLEVTTTEGTVALLPAGVGSAAIRVDAGRTLVVTASKSESKVRHLSAREIQRRLAWRDGFYDFVRTPLSEVVNEMTRHSALKIEITDRQLAALEFDGVFRFTETESLLQALEELHGLRVEPISEQRIRISPPSVP
jgi:transmembrane sensor